MKTILRNFLTTLRRFKLASALNILGLSVAFAAFMVIMMQVHYENTFDACYKKTGRIYRIANSFDSTTYSPISSRPFLDIVFAASPQIEASSLVAVFSSPIYINIDRGDGRVIGFRETQSSIYRGMLDIFDYEILEGTADALNEPRKVLLPQSIAKKFFPEGGAVGRIIRNGDADSITYEVGGVYRDFPANSSIANNIKFRMPDDENLKVWGNNNYNGYVLLHEAANPEDVARMMTELVGKAEMPEWMGTKRPQVRLSPVEDLYYDTTMDVDLMPKGNKATTNVLFMIAILVVLIAAINFVNFSTSLTPIRIKSINTQKVLGSMVSTLRAALVFEAVGICLISYVISIFLVSGMNSIGMSGVFSWPIDFAGYMPAVYMTLGVAILVGFVSGIYPAVYTTSFPPALVLKGSFGMSPEGRRLRNMLIGFQFVVSIALIVAAVFMQLQNKYVRSFDSGMDTEQVAMVDLNDELSGKYKDALVNNLKSSSLISDVAFAMSRFGSGDFYMTWGRQFRDGESINFTCMPVSYNFIDVMGLEMVEGRTFQEGDCEKENGTFIFNEVTQKQYKLTLDDQVEGHTGTKTDIVGFVKDFNFMSLRQSIQPLALYEFGPNAWQELSVAYIKIKGNPYEAVDHIKSAIGKIDPAYPVDVEFFDTMFNLVYQKETKTTALITFFSLLAVMISLVGVFGLVVFETQFRRKEIGIRKVHGATVGEILAMFNRNFVRIVLICFVVAAPLAWFGITMWLESFAYKTPIYWWVFLFALVVVMIITLCTVTIQSWKAATENPVKSIKSE